MDKYEVIVTATAQSILLQFTDINTGNVIDLSGCTEAKLQGYSTDLPSNTIDQAGSIQAGTAGLILWENVGGDAYVSMADLGDLDEATYICEARVKDINNEYFFSPRFQVTWKKPVIL